MNNLTSRVAGVILLLGSAERVPGQAPAEFEVASIKPASRLADSSSSDLLPGGRFRAANKTVQWLMRAALEMPDEQILGGPDWVRTEGYDIEAETGGVRDMTPQILKPLLLRLLADRFRLRFHIEKRELPVYLLRAEAPKLKPHSGESAQSMSNSLSDGKIVLHATRISTGDLAAFLARQIRRPVVNATGIPGEFDLNLEWTPDEGPDSSAPSIFAALREQLGIRLESGRRPVDVAVIDSVERPSAN